MNLWLTNPHGVDTEEDKMNRRERKQARREERDKVRREAEAAALPPAHFDTEGEANSALSETAHVINMKERQKAKEAKTMKGTSTATKKTTTAAKPRQSATGLPPMPALPKARKNRPEKPCECGCGTTTKSKFAPGHDSYLKGWVLRVERGVVKIADVPDFCRAKVAAMVKERKAEAGKTSTETASGKTNGAVKATKGAGTGKKTATAKAKPATAPAPLPEDIDEPEGDEAAN